MSKTEFMKAFWDLMASIIQRAKDKGFDILLLLGMVAGLIWYIQRTESAWESDKREMRASLVSVSAELKDCNSARESLSVRVALQDERIKAMENVMLKRK